MFPKFKTTFETQIICCFLKKNLVGGREHRRGHGWGARRVGGPKCRACLSLSRTNPRWRLLVEFSSVLEAPGCSKNASLEFSEPSCASPGTAMAFSLTPSYFGKDPWHSQVASGLVRTTWSARASKWLAVNAGPYYYDYLRTEFPRLLPGAAAVPKTVV